MVLCRKSSSEVRGRGRANANGDLVRDETDDEPDDCSHLSGSGTPPKSESKPSIFKSLRCHWRKCKRRTMLNGTGKRGSTRDSAASDSNQPTVLPVETRSNLASTVAVSVVHEHHSLQSRAPTSVPSPPGGTSSSDANDNYVSGSGHVECQRSTPVVSACCSHRANHTEQSTTAEPTSSELASMPRTLTVDFRINSLTQELFKLSKYGWYWGPITRSEAEEKLADQPDGAFLVRDSSDDRYLLSLSFKSYGKTLHTRIEHCSGLFSFYAQSEPEGRASIVDLIQESMNYSQSGVFCYSRGRNPGVPSFPVRLIKPVSRLIHVRSLQYLCRFVIRQYTRFDHIQRLPLPSRIRGYIEEGHY